MKVMLLSLWGSCTMLMAQGYIYTFHSTGGSSVLDGSYVVLSNTVPGAPTLADLLDVKILDSYRDLRVFEVAVTAQGFNVTSFDAQGFNGTIFGIAQSYVSPTAVTLAGMDSNPGITASNNGFFPGNPSGEAVFGEWIARPIPEPGSVSLVLFALVALALGRTSARNLK